MVQCNGTNDYHQYNQFFASALITDGVKLVADEFGAYWMIDLILSYQTREFKKKNHDDGYFIQHWTLEVKDGIGLAYMNFNHGGTNVIEQKIPFTDFPMGKFLWTYNSYDSVICLPAED